MELTRDKVLAMESHELSIEIAERIFQAKIISKEDEPESKLLIGYFGKQAWRPINHSWHNAKWRNSEEQAWLDCPRYAEDISASWEVVEQIKKTGSEVELGVYRVTNAVTIGKTTVHSDDSMPLAICRAALLTTLSELEG